MIYGYARVSSRGQERDGNSLEAQENMLLSRGCQRVFKEAYTGTKMERPVFQELVSLLQPGDTLMVAKLDRFARTVVEGVQVIQELVQRGVCVDIANMGRAENTPMGKLMVYMMLAFAEFERDTIMDRLNSGKEVKRSRGGKCEGRNRLDVPEFEKYLQKQKDGRMTVKECCKELGISRSTWYDRVKELEEVILCV